MSGELVEKIMSFESGEMEEHEVYAFFQFLVDTNLIYGLQGSYQRTAQQLLDAGLIHPPQEQYATGGLGKIQDCNQARLPTRIIRVEARRDDQ